MDSGTWGSSAFTSSSISGDSCHSLQARPHSTQDLRLSPRPHVQPDLCFPELSGANVATCFHTPQDAVRNEAPIFVKRSRGRPKNHTLPPSNTTDFKKVVSKAAGGNAVTSEARLRTDHCSPFKYHCKFCPRRFETKKVRKEHMSDEHPKPYACSTCSGRFSRKFDYEKHYLTVHERIRPFVCNECEKAFGQKHHLLRHMDTIHLKWKVFGCKHCNSTFGRKEHLQNHIKSVHKKFNYSCVLCNSGFYERKVALEHLDNDHKVRVVNAAVFLASPARSGVVDSSSNTAA
ncbi:hypothetical protein BWQ96_08691 [Gracilariopsis chorda]|uniref:C2H2-type domain-containing protein n=1 Tax=Gracilariopsis chorda TaxID=448386 RepID=A0A2V3IHN2_9FLOR|nr:hypothetical protein BWQ96_08691 [Gracilariopsis chorda]|eukprot:PXF41604.1 hypothetical protein BWQ96_08691 [Gracilariopsis chorda]